MDVEASSNGSGSEAWTRSWTHLQVDRRSPSYCRVTFDHAPINTITATTVAELAELVGLIEQDSDLNVVVFDSANPDFYLAHYDIENDPARTASLGVGPTGMHAWHDLLVRLARAPVVSIAAIRGHVREEGREFALACDLRFVAENTPVDVLRAELHGYVSRLTAADRFDDEVEAMATRLARFDREALARTKSYPDLIETLPDP